MFSKASRLKLRFDSPKGPLSAEDLWDLPLTSATGKVNLDDIAKAVNKELKSTQEESFVVKETKGNEILQLKLEILKTVIGVKMIENEAAATARAKAEEKQRIMGLIAKKKDEVLEGKSLDELMALLNAM